jgi:hypothetical protein
MAALVQLSQIQPSTIIIPLPSSLMHSSPFFSGYLMPSLYAAASIPQPLLVADYTACSFVVLGLYGLVIEGTPFSQELCSLLQLVSDQAYSQLILLVFIIKGSVTGIIWLVQSSPYFIYGGSNTLQTLQLDDAVARWVPALGFSVGLDTLTTGMIAGRLVYHHRMQKKLGGTHITPYLPLVVIFIESAALSLISKVIQLSTYSILIARNPLVIPLCVSELHLY